MLTMLKTFLSDPAFQVSLTLVIYLLSYKLYQRFHIFIFNPLILASVVIIYLLTVTHTDYAVYSKGGDMFTFLLGPATVALAVPLYKQLPLIKANYKSIFSGVIAGSFTAILSSVLIAEALGASRETVLSLAAKSTTMPIALGITKILGGNDNFIVLAVAVTGIFGGAVGPEILKLAGVRSKIATGIGIGTASHAGGTSRALQLGETEGSMSGTAIVLTGLVTALLAPVLVKLILP